MPYKKMLQDIIQEHIQLPPENSKTSVFWDPELGIFSSSSRSSSASQVPGTELLYTGQSISFGGPLMNDQHYRGRQQLA
ncbi:hypothetical protein SLEP1_g11218 [Rubroshorea leprosula]|uniref:Uncharacterized protein n=1 Tax=Rubroshorea leprosula TaxID=152421 RepID=A0AAV5IM03_9ROSI|nr:hypothetical protein SLEP1_g11218 [Rubroshorea leprosula]